MQRTQLLEIFEKDPYPSRALQNKLADEMGVPADQINRWFSSYRYLKKIKQDTGHYNATPVQVQTGKTEDTILHIYMLMFQMVCLPQKMIQHYSVI